MVHQIATLDEFIAKVTREGTGKLVVVDFWAVWCGPCVRFSPKFEEMSESADYSDVIFYKVNIAIIQFLDHISQ